MSLGASARAPSPADKLLLLVYTAFSASDCTYRLLILRDLVRGNDESLERAALSRVCLHPGLEIDAAGLRATWKEGCDSTTLHY